MNEPAQLRRDSLERFVAVVRLRFEYKFSSHGALAARQHFYEYSSLGHVLEDPDNVFRLFLKSTRSFKIDAWPAISMLSDH